MITYTSLFLFIYVSLGSLGALTNPTISHVCPWWEPSDSFIYPWRNPRLKVGWWKATKAVMRTVINNKENDTTTIKSNNENYKGNINNMTLSIQIDNINNNDGGQMILRYGKFGLVCTWNLPLSKTYLTRRLSTASRSQICWFTVAWRHLIQTLWDQGINVDTELALLGSGHTQVITSLHIQCNVYFAVFISLQSRLCQCRHRRYVGGQTGREPLNMKPSSPDMGI